MALTFLSSPRASLDTLTRAMTRVYSPASTSAAALYQIPLRYGLDPAVAWAFAWHEHQFFTHPDALTITAGKNWGALRRGQGNAYKEANGFAWYRTFEAGLEDWCLLIARVYIPRGQTTVELALLPPNPKQSYAPSSDNNRPAEYIRLVNAKVRDWADESGYTLAPSSLWDAWGDAYPLPPEQRLFGIPNEWYLDGGKLGAAISPEVAAPWGAFRFFERGAIAWYRDGNQTRIYR